jgi:hypothetical protein
MINIIFRMIFILLNLILLLVQLFIFNKAYKYEQIALKTEDQELKESLNISIGLLNRISRSVLIIMVLLMVMTYWLWLSF